MRSVMVGVVLALLAGAMSAQEAPAYTRVGNPYQADFAFKVGQPVGLRVEVAGLLLSDITVAPRHEIEAGKRIKCSVVVHGMGPSEQRVTLHIVLLLEDAGKRGLERIDLDPFRVKAGKAVDREETVKIGGDTLLGASRIYLFAEVEKE